MFEFELVIELETEFIDIMNSDVIIDKLYEAGCDDATISMREPDLCIQFSRTGPSICWAVTSAIENIKKAYPNAKIIKGN